MQMTCIYCHQPLKDIDPDVLPSNMPIITCLNCPHIDVKYIDILNNNVFDIVYLFDVTYGFEISVVENYTAFYIDSEFVTAVSGLHWIFPDNIEYWIHKFNQLKVFL